MTCEDLWGWAAPFVIWCTYHYSTVFVVILFVLQGTHQVLKIIELVRVNKSTAYKKK